MSDSAVQYASDVASRLSTDFIGALYVVREDGTILAWNSGAEVLFGYTAAEAIGTSIFATIIPEETRDRERVWLREVVDAADRHESVRTRRDSVRIWVDVSLRAHVAPDGMRLLVLNERDITRIKYQREAHNLQTRFRGVLDTGPDAIVMVDRSGRMVLVNTETERLFGYRREELLGEFVEALVPVRFHRGHPVHRSKYFDEPQTRPMGIGLELSGRRKDGVEFPVEISLSPLTIDDEQLAMAAIRDVTGRKKTEEALKAANAELEAFTYSVSHDLRAPIRQIEGFSQILAEQLGTDIDEKVAHQLRRIQEGSRHMGRLVDDLLNLARIGRQDVKLRPTQLGPIVSDAIAAVQELDPGRTIEWSVGPLPQVTCDPGLLKVVFTNLLSNAVKYSRPRARAVVAVSASVRGGVPAFTVRDNGVGFDMQYADKLFGVFQRLHRAEDFEGTGVGLATVQRIIRKHRGEIWAESAPDAGAAFHFTLGPAITADAG